MVETKLRKPKIAQVRKNKNQNTKLILTNQPRIVAFAVFLRHPTNLYY